MEASWAPLAPWAWAPLGVACPGVVLGAVDRDGQGAGGHPCGRGHGRLQLLWAPRAARWGRSPRWVVAGGLAAAVAAVAAAVVVAVAAGLLVLRPPANWPHFGALNLARAHTAALFLLLSLVEGTFRLHQKPVWETPLGRMATADLENPLETSTPNR